MLQSRRVNKVTLASTTPGVQTQLSVYEYGPQDEGVEKCYIHAALHADELPGLLVLNHLIKQLDDLDTQGLIAKRITILPYANPIGLAQDIFGSHIGRFSTKSGTNFNRDFNDYTKKVTTMIKEGHVVLSADNATANANAIRKCIYEILEEELLVPQSSESSLKKEILKRAITSDIVLDLHCDTNALLHMYTHTRLWPEMKDLAGDLGAWGTFVEEESGGTPLDEACSAPWAQLQDQYKGQFPIPMACASVTVELRGHNDVSDELASKDASALKTFLTRRGYIASASSSSELPPVVEPPRDATPLTAVEFIEASACGLFIEKKKLGDMVKPGDVVGEVVSIDDPNAPRVPILSRSEGLVFCLRAPIKRLVRPGDIVVKITGEKVLPWREGNLLTAR
jgi:uncharacterized protein